MIKDKYYRVTEKNGKKWKGSFDSEISFLGIDCYRFHFESKIIEKDLIEKIEEITIIAQDTIARQKGCFEEFIHYGTCNGVKINRKYIYKQIKKGK